MGENQIQSHTTYISEEIKSQLLTISFTGHRWEGNLDFITMFSAVNTGLCNPRILAAVTEQMNKSKCFLSHLPFHISDHN